MIILWRGISQFRLFVTIISKYCSLSMVSCSSAVVTVPSWLEFVLEILDWLRRSWVIRSISFIILSSISSRCLTIWVLRKANIKIQETRHLMSAWQLVRSFGFLVSKETVVLRRWERSKQEFGFIKRVDKGWITTVKDLESWRFER